jgi:type III secretory pathway component EscV
MTKKIIYSIICLIALSSINFSCQRKPDQKIKPVSNSLGGDLADYLQIVSDEYDVASPYALNLNLSFKVKAIKAINPSDIKNKDITITAVLFDNSGTPIPGIQFSSDSDDELLSLLKKGSGEEIIQLSAVVLGDLDFNNIKSFSVSSTIKNKEKEDTVSSSSQDSSAISQDTSTLADNSNINDNNGSNSDYDQLLDTYQKNTDDYIKLVKSMQKDNAGAVMDNYAQVLQNSLDLQQKLTAVKGKLTIQQANRLVHIELKLANAMAKANTQK